MSGTPVDRDGNPDPQPAPATSFHDLRPRIDSLGFGDTVRSALRDHCRRQHAEEHQT